MAKTGNVGRAWENIPEVPRRILTCICRASSKGARTASRRGPKPALGRCCTRSTSSRDRRSRPCPQPWPHRPRAFVRAGTAPCGPARTPRSRKPPARRPGDPRATASPPVCLSSLTCGLLVAPRVTLQTRACAQSHLPPRTPSVRLNKLQKNSRDAEVSRRMTDSTATGSVSHVPGLAPVARDERAIERGFDTDTPRDRRGSSSYSSGRSGSTGYERNEPAPDASPRRHPRPRTPPRASEEGYPEPIDGVQSHLLNLFDYLCCEPPYSK